MALLSTLLLAILARNALAEAAPEPLITNAPAILQERDQSPLIGYELVGNGYVPITCNTGTFTTSGSWGICCPVASCYYGTKCSGGSIYYDRTDFVSNCNTGTGPAFCYTVTLYKSTGDQSPLHMFNCESNWQATFTTDAALATNTYTSTAPTTTSSSSRTSSGTSSSPSASAASTSTAPLSTGPAVPQQKSSNAGLIAGATIGGIAALALIGAAVFLAIRYTKATTNKDENAANAANGGPNGAGQETSQAAYAEPYKTGVPFPSQQQQPVYGAPGYPAEMQGTVPGQHWMGQQELMGTPVGEMPAVTSPTPQP